MSHRQLSRVKRREELVSPSDNPTFYEEDAMQFTLQLDDLGYWDWDFTSNTLHHTHALRTLLGGPTRPPLLSMASFLQCVHPEDRDAVRLSLQDIFSGDTEQRVLRTDYEFRVVWPDGSVHWIESHGKLHLDASARPLRATGVCLNIDNRKLAEEMRQSSEEWLRLALDAARMGTWDWDIVTGNVTWSEQVEPLFGLPKGAFRGTYQDYLTHIHPEDLAHVEQVLAGLFEGAGTDYSIEHRIIRQDGSMRWLEGKGKVYRDGAGRPYRMNGTVADITERKLAEQVLQEREEMAQRFSVQLKQLHHVSIELSRVDSLDMLCRLAVERGRSELGFDRLSIWLYNKDLTQLLGTYGTDEQGNTRDEHGQVWSVDADWMTEFRDYGIPLNIRTEAVLRNQQSGVVGHGWTVTAALQDGEIPIGVLSVDNLLQKEPLRESQIELLGLYGTVIGHLCLRKRVEEALRESETTARALLDATSDVALLASASGILIACNEAFARGVHKEMEEIVGTYLWNYLPGHIVEKRKPTVYELLQTGKVMRFEDHVEQGWFDTCLYPIFDAQGNVHRIAMYARNITERKQMEMQLLQAQKMESIGRLAGGIAHDFNNLLTAILGYADLAKDYVADNINAINCLDAIDQAGQRAATLTSQLLAFARKQIIEPRTVNLNTLVLDTEKLLHRLIGEDIELVTRPGANLWYVKIDPGQFEQILVNLAVNARDAMPDGGKLVIETSNVVVDSDHARQLAGIIPGSYVMLAISDTGVGIEKSVQQHIFEPFFTTKSQGKGTGLGLATCHGIVQQNGGTIVLSSEPGVGTRFEIYLPREMDSLAVVSTERKSPGTPNGFETILLVEDEPMVRAIAAQTLREQGYTVLEAGNGVEALTLADSYAGAIHLVVTDVVMPQMGGKELMERLEKTRRNVKTLYMSGYTDRAIVHRGVLDPGVSLLHKPFTPDAMARKVHEVLGSTEGDRGAEGESTKDAEAPDAEEMPRNI